MKRKLGEILVAAGAVTQEELDLALTDQHAGDPSRVGELLVAMGKITPQQLARALSAHHTVPYVELPPIPPPVLELVPLNFQRQHRLVPFRIDGERLSVAIAEPSDSEAIRELRVLVGNDIKVVLFVAPIDEIDAVHASMGEDVDLALEVPSVPNEVPVASSPSKLDELFGDLDLPASEVVTAEVAAPPQEPLFAPSPPPSTFDDPLFGPVPEVASRAALFDPPMELTTSEEILIADEEAPPESTATFEDGPALEHADALELDRAPHELPVERVEDMPFDPPAQEALPPPPPEVSEFESGPTDISPAPALPPPEWTGVLDDVQPSRLMLAVAKALVLRGYISEQDVLDALSKK